MMRTTVSTQPQIIIVVCCITLRRSAYGAWGNYSVHGADGKKATDATFIGHINPLRYRGYYYDRETRLYYLQSRYYDFANCRFINADTFATTDANGFLSANMFAYCENNPIMLVDQDGGVPVIIAGALIGGLVGAISGALSSALQGGDKSEIMAGALSGMVTGFVAGVVSTAAPILAAALDVSGVAMLGAASAVSGAVGTLSSALSQKSTKGKVDWGEAVLNGGLIHLHREAWALLREAVELVRLYVQLFKRLQI